MKILILGGGGREHSIAWKLRRSGAVSEIVAIPGNPGLAQLGRCHPSISLDPDSLVAFAEKEHVDLTVVGPEALLERGVVDSFRARGLAIVGPTQAAARLETSKAFAKEVMREAGVATALSETAHSLGEGQSIARMKGVPLVLKADGLAAGKGVCVCHSASEIESGLLFLFNELKCEIVLIESFLSGVEASLIVATNGVEIVPLASAHDYKRLLDANRGPNTGGMGTVSPTPRLPPDIFDRAVRLVVEPTLIAMERRGTPFSGFLYAGLMLSEGGDINVLEFNARLGDPETQVILRRLETDLLPLLQWMAAPAGTVVRPSVAWREDSAACVVLASEGYPYAPRSGEPIEGIELASGLPGNEVFHAGTSRRENGMLVTSGGRVLNVTATAPTADEARRRAYRAVDIIQFPGRVCRRDIGL